MGHHTWPYVTSRHFHFYLRNKWQLYQSECLVNTQFKTHLLNSKWLYVVLVGLGEISVILVFVLFTCKYVPFNNLIRSVIRLHLFSIENISNKVICKKQIPSNPVWSGCEWSLKGFCQSHVVCRCVYGLGLCTVTGDQQVCDCWTSTGRVKG